MRLLGACFVALVVGCSSGNFNVAGGDAGADTSLDDSSVDDTGGCATDPCTCTDPLFRCGATCVNRGTDPDHCGACSVKCPRVTNGTATCGNGKCGATCDTGFHACDTQCLSNGSPSSCGTACTPCTAGANASPTCGAKGCGIQCHAGYADCDSNHADCETELGTATNCNGCGDTCTSPTPTCAPKLGGGFGCTADCLPPNSVCGKSCVDVTSSTKNCGSCGHDCGSDPNGTWSCVSSACKLDCDTGFHACGGACVPDDDKSACGTTCTNCTDPPNAVGFCDATTGKCDFTCNTGFADCDPAAPGCETNIDTDPSHCSGCDVICAAPPGTIATCTGGTCGTSCAPGYVPLGTRCAVFAGAFEPNGSCGCAAHDPLATDKTTDCSACPSGFDTVTLNVTSACGSGASLNLCEAPVPATLPPAPPAVDWGGIFVDSACDGGTCEVKNGYSGGCSCPAGSKEILKVIVLASLSCGDGKPGTVHVCQGTGAPVTFFGAYAQYPDGHCDPVGCSCPSGSHATKYPVMMPSSSTGGSGSIVFCTN